MSDAATIDDWQTVRGSLDDLQPTAHGNRVDVAHLARTVEAPSPGLAFRFGTADGRSLVLEG